MKNIDGYIFEDDFELEEFKTKSGQTLYVVNSYATEDKQYVLRYFAKDRVCAVCGKLMGKYPLTYGLVCDACIEDIVQKDYEKMPSTKYVGQPVFLDGELIHEDELPEYLKTTNKSPHIIEAIQYSPSEFYLSDWCDDIDIDDIQEVNDTINKLIEGAVGEWYVEGNARIEYDEEYYRNVKEAREKNEFVVLG